MTEEERIKAIHEMIDAMAEAWSAPVVSRKEVKVFTGGTVSGKSLANEDSKGSGVDDRFLLMGQTVYPKKSLCTWLKTKSATGWKTRRRAA